MNIPIQYVKSELRIPVFIDNRQASILSLGDLSHEVESCE